MSGYPGTPPLEVVEAVVNVYGRGTPEVLRHRVACPIVVVVELTLADGTTRRLEAPIEPMQAAELLVGRSDGQGVRLARRWAHLDLDALDRVPG